MDNIYFGVSMEDNLAILRVEQSGPIHGTIRVDGAKNAVLPILAGALLAEDVCILEGVPALKDVEVMLEVLKSLGATTSKMNGDVVEINIPQIVRNDAPYELIQKMRASFLVMGPLLARTGRARVSMPGGCAIGARPVDLHLKGFESLGANVELGHGYIEASVEGRLKGANIYLDFPSVGATENIMMAATLAEGVTILENAAKEPEIIDLANFLNKMGAKVLGAGTDTIKITGVEALTSTRHTIIPDRIAAATYMIMGATVGGELKIENVVSSHVKPIIAKLREVGAEVQVEDDYVIVRRDGELVKSDITSLPYPGFPTDAQAPFMALLAVAGGTSVVNETVFENRFKHISELNRMGASIKIEGHSAVVQGVNSLQSAQVKATDLRAGAALIIAGMVADGVTEIGDIYHIDRGYPSIEDKLQPLGVKITRVDNE